MIVTKEEALVLLDAYATLHHHVWYDDEDDEFGVEDTTKLRGLLADAMSGFKFTGFDGGDR